MAVDLVSANVIDVHTATQRLAGYDLRAISRTTVRQDEPVVCLASGTPAGPGVATGTIAFSVARAQRLARDVPVILVRPDLATDDIAGLASAIGLLTSLGGRTSHAAVVARQLNKSCVVGCEALRIDEPARTCCIGDRVFGEGDVLTIDGDTGRVYEGPVRCITEHPDSLLATVDGWRRASVASPV